MLHEANLLSTISVNLLYGLLFERLKFTYFTSIRLLEVTQKPAIFSPGSDPEVVALSMGIPHKAAEIPEKGKYRKTALRIWPLHSVLSLYNFLLLLEGISLYRPALPPGSCILGNKDTRSMSWQYGKIYSCILCFWSSLISRSPSSAGNLLRFPAAIHISVWSAGQFL